MRPGLLAASLGLKSVPHTLPETLPNIPALYPLGQFVMYYLARSLFEYPFRFPIVSLLGKIPKGVTQSTLKVATVVTMGQRLVALYGLMVNLWSCVL